MELLFFHMIFFSFFSFSLILSILIVHCLCVSVIGIGLGLYFVTIGAGIRKTGKYCRGGRGGGGGERKIKQNSILICYCLP